MILGVRGTFVTEYLETRLRDIGFDEETLFTKGILWQEAFDWMLSEHGWYITETRKEENGFWLALIANTKTGRDSMWVKTLDWDVTQYGCLTQMITKIENGKV